MAHQPSRRRLLNATDVQTNGKVVVYRMSRDQRIADNHALLFAQRSALEMQLPLVVWFHQATPSHRTHTHLDFILGGLNELTRSLAQLNISLVETSGSLKCAIKTITQLSPALLVWDFSPLRGLVSQQQQAVEEIKVTHAVVDTHNIVPAWVVSEKQEWSAYTLRRKISSLLPQYTVEPERVISHPFSSLIGGSLHKLGTSGNRINREKEAEKKLAEFIENKLCNYAVEKNDPTREATSGLSPFLHFGHISPLRVVLEVNKAVAQNHSLQKSAEVFLEELIVRRELAENFCFYNRQYDSLEGAPDWAKKTLRIHVSDRREYTYSYAQLEQGETHDPAWNAAQKQMIQTGYMHGYMRMYWAKKILEWTDSPEEAITYAVRLNDTYELDGHDPNGYAGILWSIAGLHDRPWFERPVYGSIRYMNANGLARKFNLREYIKRWDI